MQGSSEQPLVGEEHCVTTLITAAKETMLNDTFVCLLLYVAWTCFRTDDVRQLRYSSHVTFVCHTDKDTKYLFDPPTTVSVGGARRVQLPSIESV